MTPQFVASIASAVGSTICFLTIMWVANGHFVRGGAVPLGSILVSLAALGGMIVFAYALVAAPYATLLPLPIFVASLALFLWAVKTTRNKGLLPAFSGDIPKRLIADGPYRYVRHPFYLAYMLHALGNAVATSSWMPWAVLSVLIGSYAYAALVEERKLSSGPFGSDFGAYRRKTGVFIPKLWLE